MKKKHLGFFDPDYYYFKKKMERGSLLEWSAISTYFDNLGGPRVMSIMRHGIWPQDLFSSTSGIAVVLIVNAAYVFLWLRDSKRLRPLDGHEPPGWIQMVFHWGWLTLSIISTHLLASAALQSFQLVDRASYICVDLETALAQRRPAMLVLFLHTVLCGHKLGQLLLIQRNRFPLRASVVLYHVGVSLMTWLCAGWFYGTTIPLLVAALATYADCISHGYAFFKAGMPHLRPTALLRVIIYLAQSPFLILTFGMAAVGSQCDGNFASTSRGLLLHLTLVLIAVCFQDFVAIVDSVPTADRTASPASNTKKRPKAKRE